MTDDSDNTNTADADGHTPDFETALAELEELVARMERGDLSLEDSLSAFERGVGLTRVCQKALTEAEQKVEVLLGDSDDDSAGLAPFDEGEGDGD
ncbi:Exodeoxyribonuclease 7 small subunit [wastewater metagenome]|uniref:Exodeoxyribonuclease 7 small subunit n=2 Tax=unclassified sequences TaxID=12908 RepID=A0A5B8R7B8_9ZZZZ|nr:MULTISPECIES: exodeoxyribonuclease VII small subunit [Arhodomonas]MCS4504399.1 exodeoxyribonuclease VII small subunit [Arhodomonas aquaeolei]QEA04566.1 exodeoxyribonuclease 7 small subunit [uncultured organism]